jgi:CRP-like cAMP-binding protein
MSDPIAEVLASVPLLSGLDRRQLERLAKDFRERSVAAGTVIIRQGDDHGMGFFVVAAGDVIVSVDGRELNRLGPGGYFGEVALISDRVRTATVTAATDVRLLVMMLTDFRAFVRGDADVAWKLLEHVGMLLHGRA